MGELGSGVYALPRSDIAYLRDMLIDPAGTLRVLPYDVLRHVPQMHLSQLCIEEGLYCVPTQELLNWLADKIGSKSAIEIGAGNGAIARALGIIGTDSKVQDRADMQALYGALRQAPVRYGRDVQEYDALAAVRKFKPSVVVAAWVTHRYNPNQHWREGHSNGVSEGTIIDRVRQYIFIGHERVHQHKPILERPHTSFKAEWLLSRSMDRELNVIWTWGA